MKARLVSSVVLATALTLGTAGCGFFVPVETAYEYAPSDGVQATAGDVRVRNALFIVNDEGTTFNLTMTTVNDSNEAATLTITTVIDGVRTSKEITVEPGATQFGNQSKGQETVVFEGLTVKAGQTVRSYFQSGDSDQVKQYIPVLDGSLEEYKPLVIGD